MTAGTSATGTDTARAEINRTEIVGGGPLADSLRDSLGSHGCEVVTEGPLDALVVVAAAAPSHHRIEDYTDDEFAEAWEQPIRAAIDALRGARRRGARRIAVITSTQGMTGAAGDAPNAMAAEALRALVKSAARQWGPDGITVNAIAVGPATLGGLPDTVAIAAPALGDVPDEADAIAPMVAFCCSARSGRLTGSTLVADGGSWMP